MPVATIRARDEPEPLEEEMSDTPLFQNADEQERTYAPQQVPEQAQQVQADEQGGIGSVLRSEEGNTPAAVPLGTGGSFGVAPASDAFTPGMDREAADIARGEGVVGPDTRDESTSAPSVT